MPPALTANLRHRPRLMRFSPWTLLCLCAVLSGCVASRVDKRLGERFDEVAAIQEARRADLGHAPQVQLSWQQAVGLAAAGNLDIRSSNSALEEHIASRKRLLLDELAPTISAYTGVSSGLDSLANISNGDVSARVIGGFRIPNPFSVYARGYGMAVQQYQLTQVRELTYRQTLSSLYSSFMQEQNIAEQRKTLAQDRKDLLRLPTPDQATRSLDLERRERLLESQQQQQRLSLNRLLNSPGANYRPRPETLPDISYSNRLDKLTPAHGFGLLALRLAAAESEAAILMLWQVKLQRLPNISLNVSSPTLWDLDSNRPTEVENLQLFGGASRGYEFSGTEARRLRNTEDRVRRSREALILRFESEQGTLLRAIDLHRESQQIEQRARQHLARLDANPPKIGAEALLRYAQELRQTRNLITMTRAQRRAIDLQFWIWDDSAWRTR